MEWPTNWFPGDVCMHVKDEHLVGVCLWWLFVPPPPPVDFLARTVFVHPVRSESGRSRWRCACGTKSTTWSALSAPHARSTFAWATVTCSSTRTLCASRTSLNGLNSTAWCRPCSCLSSFPAYAERRMLRPCPGRWMMSLMVLFLNPHFFIVSQI